MFPIQEKLLTRNQYSRPGTAMKTVRGIVIHWTANEGVRADALANIRFFENRKLGKTGFGSAHYFVDSKSIVRCLPENELAYHVGATSYRTKQFGAYPNDCTIGIELCVNVDGDFDIVYQQGLELAAYLVKKYKLDPIKDVTRHYDITGKNCPAMFTSDHWGKLNNNYSLKYGLGPSAEASWITYKNKIKAHTNGTTIKDQPYQYDISKGIGTIRILVNDLNIRKGNSFTAPVDSMAKIGAVFYCYETKNGMHNVGGDLWLSAGNAYTAFTAHPKTAVVPKPTPPPVAPAKPIEKEVTELLKDIANHWAKNDIESLVQKGIVKGDEKGNFNPNQSASRAHLAVMLNRTVEYIVKEIEKNRK